MLSNSEHVNDFEGLEARLTQFGSGRTKPDSVETCSSHSVHTTHSQASSSLIRPHLSVDGKPDDQVPRGDKFKLKTLEEHRFATRFQEKRVTPQTWRKAKKDAYKLIASQDRINLVEALYLLLEIIWLQPRGTSLSPLYLNAGSIYLTFDHLEEAAKSYRHCLRLDPDSWKARYNLGVTLARSRDLVDAKYQFDLALQICPRDAVDEVQAMIEEIEHIQRERNERAFNETDKARTFTAAYLETLHCVAAKPWELTRAIAGEDYTESSRSAPPSLSPLLFHEVKGWQGAIAGLLHRLYALAFARTLSIDEEFLRMDPTRSGCITIEDLGIVLFAITGSELSARERSELLLISEDR